jgi:hypothetical protein
MFSSKIGAHAAIDTHIRALLPGGKDCARYTAFFKKGRAAYYPTVFYNHSKGPGPRNTRQYGPFLDSFSRCGA